MKVDCISELTGIVQINISTRRRLKVRVNGWDGKEGKNVKQSKKENERKARKCK